MGALNLLTLKFSDSGLEREYVKFYNQTALLSVEKVFTLVDLFVYCVFIFYVEPFSGDSFWTMVAKVVGFSIILSHYALIRLLNQRVWIRYRAWIIVLFRTLRMGLVICQTPLWEAPSGEESLWMKAIVRSGALANLWFSMGMPLIHRQFLVLHFFHIFGTALVLSAWTCRIIVKFEESEAAFQRVWKVFNAAFKAVGGGQTPCPPNEQPCAMDSVRMCWSLIFILNTHIVFGLPILAFWYMELGSRQSYVKEQHRCGRWRDIDTSSFFAPDVFLILGIFFHSFHFLALFAALGLVGTSVIWTIVIPS